MLELLSRVPDPRDPQGVRYPLAGMLAVGVSAVLAGARSFTAIGEWAGEVLGEDLDRLGLATAPQESTLRKLFARIDADALDRQVGAFLWARTRHFEGRTVIAINGKTIRGARSGDRAAPHLVAALEHTAAVALGQIAVAAKGLPMNKYSIRDGVGDDVLHGCGRGGDVAGEVRCGAAAPG